MRIHFWGVRGSCPTPLKPTEVTGKLSAALQRIKTDDIETPQAKEKFISRLPRHIRSTIGGNTACVEVRLEDNTLIIFDAGTGIRSLYDNMIYQGDMIQTYHLFMTHFHYDHLIGMPYFASLYNPDNHVHIYSPYSRMEEIIKGFFRKPYHPVPFEAFAANITFHVLDNESTWIGPAKIDWIKRPHPDGSIAYRVEEGSGTFIFSTDTELEDRNFKKTRRNLDFFHGVNLLVMDGQYSLGEAIEKMTWGHSSYSMAIEFALEFDIDKLLLYHHEPMNDDKELEKIKKIAQTYADMLNKKQGKRLILDFAMEEDFIEL